MIHRRSGFVEKVKEKNRTPTERKNRKEKNLSFAIIENSGQNCAGKSKKLKEKTNENRL